MDTKQEIFEEKLGEYLQASKEEKGRILDAVCEVTKAHRKAAIRRFGTLQMEDDGIPDKRGRSAIYTKAVGATLKEIWDMAHQICAERLHPSIGEYVTILKRDKMWKHDADTTSLLSKMSLATMKRRVAKFPKVHGRRKGKGTTNPSNLKEIIPIRRGPWQNPDPGFGEVDTVAHCGSTLQGDFAYTVQYTDVSTIWTCLSAQWNKGEEATKESMIGIKSRLPFPLLGIDPDSGSEFINWNLKHWCDREKIVMTRTRPSMKNDHARIEQKNYTNVREFIGYVRIDNFEAVKIMNELYSVLEDYINFFLPSMKCISKERIGSRYIRKYDKAQTAYRRVLAHPLISNETKERLKQKYATLNPKLLKTKSDRLIHKLYANKSAAQKKDYGNTYL
jgi:hypothetical protein